MEFVDVRGKEADVVTVGAIAAATGLDPNDVVDAVESLCAAGFLIGPLQKPMTGGDARPWYLENSLLGERGLRVVGAWPSEDPYEDLVKILERRIEEASDPEKKSKLQALLSSVGEVGKTAIAGLLVEVAKGDLHF